MAAWKRPPISPHRCHRAYEWRKGHGGETSVLRYLDPADKRHRKVDLDAGSSDRVDCFREGRVGDPKARFWTLTENRRLGYLGAQAFYRGQETCNVFMQDDEQAIETLGPKGRDYAAATIIRRLDDYCID